MHTSQFLKSLTKTLWVVAALEVSPLLAQPFPDVPGPPPGVSDIQPRPFPPPPQITILPPELESFQINSGTATTSTVEVKLNSQAMVGTSPRFGRARLAPTHYRASEQAGFAGAQWLDYQSAPGFTLSQGAGEKTVYLQVANLSSDAPPTGAYSAVHCDSIRVLDPNARMEFSLGSVDAYAMGTVYGFGFSATPLDPTSQCMIRPRPGSSRDLRLTSYGRPLGPLHQMAGSRCEFTLFGQQELQDGWTFKSYGLNHEGCSGATVGYRVEAAPVEDSRSIVFRIRTWSEPDSVCELNLSRINLDGPEEADWADAFR